MNTKYISFLHGPHCLTPLYVKTEKCILLYKLYKFWFQSVHYLKVLLIISRLNALFPIWSMIIIIPERPLTAKCMVRI